MKDIQIPTSNGPITEHMAISGVILLLTCVAATILLNSIPISHNFNLSILLIWTVIPLFWLGATMVMIKKVSKTKYVLTKNAVIITKPNWIMSQDEILVRYNAIVTASSKSHLGGRYGSIKLSLADNLDPVVLSHVKNPEIYTREIKEIIANKSDD